MLSISEIYGPVIQGEGPVIGTPTIFIRFGGCDFRCSWCDSLHAVLPEYKDSWRKMNAAEVAAEVNTLARGTPFLITLSGGNPALFDTDELIDRLKHSGHSVAIETQGTKAPAWFAKLDWLVLSPKPPSSGMPCHESEVEACLHAAGPTTRTALKVVVGSDADYQFALGLHHRFPEIDFYIQPLNLLHSAPTVEDHLTALRALMERVCADGCAQIKVLPQLHVLLYGNERGR